MHQCPFLQWLMSVGYKCSYFFLPHTMNTEMGQFADHLDIFKQCLYVIEKYLKTLHNKLNTGHCEKPAICPIHTSDVPFMTVFYRRVGMCLKQILCSWMGYKGYAHIMVWKYRTNCFVYLHYDDMRYMRSDVFAICL